MGDCIKVVEVHQMLDGSFHINDEYDNNYIAGIVDVKDMNKELNKLFKSREQCEKEYHI